MPRPLVTLLAAFLAASPLLAQEQPPPQQPTEAPTSIPSQNETPWFLRWMLHPNKRGMLVNLPVIDTDPNRGTTGGVLPIWIITEKNSERIEQMHAPSITYNKVFKINTTYRYYYYPDSKSALILRAAASSSKERELLVDYATPSFLDRDIDFAERVQYNVDRSNRFFGEGDRTRKIDESTYTDNIIHNNLTVGIPVVPESKVRVHWSNHIAGKRVYGANIPNIPDITTRWVGAAANHRQTVNESQFMIDYDTRDDATTTSTGYFVRASAGGSLKGFISEFDFMRYSFDARNFHRWADRPKWVTASRFYYEDLFGQGVPFWLKPKLGGKYNFRAYGDGRYIDFGTLNYQVEHRMIFYSEKMAGVTVDVEAAPFVGFGSVFNHLEHAVIRSMRPVYGIAMRAVARPQVVGSVDFGWGDEGMAAFVDINYSF
jgi:hypothetical protein